MDGIDFISAINTLPTITSVTGSGVAVGEYDRVSFSINIVGCGENGSVAKKKIAEPLARLQELLRTYQNEGINFAENETISPFSLSRETRWDKDDREVFSHYEATYGLSFVVMGVEQVTRILDDLTEVEGLQTSTPRFMMGEDQTSDLYRQALKNAVTDARQSFALQCELLGLSANNYEVLKWNSCSGGNTGVQGSTGSIGVSGPSCTNGRSSGPRIIINPGEALVHASIDVSFTRTPKALMDYVARSAEACENSDLF